MAEGDTDEFLDRVAHELKTPLTPLKAVAQLARSRLRRARSGERDLDLEQLDVSLATIDRQVDRMARLVTDVLEVSRIARGRFALQKTEFDLVEIVRGVVKRISEQPGDEERHHIELEAPDALRLTGDRERIEQVISHLVANAVKFSPQGGTVRVHVEQRGAEASVTVTDEGIGISAEDIARLGTRPFVRAERAKGYAGIGAGLYLARVVAEGHGGRMEITSEGDDKGTTARLTLAL
ncbi:MAG: hypothetical protein HYX56_07805 [Chloroflexi bacterium]|nr:hypothetical protein [Chloroflexota bacterium]